MNFMAIVACNTIILVLATVPLVAHATLVAGKTLVGTLLLISHCISAFLEDNIRCSTAFDIRITLQVLFTSAVTRLACGGVCIAPDTMLGLVDRQNRCRLAFIVTLGAECIFFEPFLRLGGSR